MDNTIKAEKYVIYARRSTDVDEKQKRSIADQITACRELAEKLDLKVVGKPIIEKISAKKAGNRPEFTEMVKKIRKGKVDSILSWHPDRLSRNLIEGGELIHMIDDGFITDLKFCSYTFTPDSGGKMTLAIIFAMAKHYTDKLSEDVKRGLLLALKDGKSAGQYKPGYLRNSDTGLYQPDSRNFKIIQKAWAMKKEGKSDTSIVEFINDSGYRRIIKKKKNRGKKEQHMDTSKVSTMFGDSFNYGVLVQSDTEIDLRDIYDFTPVVSEEDFHDIQKHRKNYRREVVKHGFPFRGLVLCNQCECPRTAGASKGAKGDRFLYYRCTSEGCPEKGKSVRAKAIIKAILSILESGFSVAPKEKSEIEKGIKKALLKKKGQAQLMLKSLRERKKARKMELLSIQDNYTESSSDFDDDEIIHYKRKKATLKNRIAELEDKIKTQKEMYDESKVDLSRTLNSLKKATESFKSGSPEKKDKIAKLLCLNILVEAGKVVSVTPKTPFDKMVKHPLFKNGGPGRN